jgi:eukaryotic-like serine/threonine-protein kinase
LFKKTSFDIFELMKNLLKKPIIRRLLIAIIIFIGFILLLNNVIMPWYVSSPEKRVPKIIGMNESQAMKTLKDSSLVPIIADTTFDDKYPSGTVLFQRPHGGEIVKIGRRVYLFISGGQPEISVPVLKGKSVRDARFALERVGLNLGQIDSVSSDDPKNMIFEQQYAPGTPLKKGDSVRVSLSIGPAYSEISVPNLIGKSLSQAEQILSDSSLKVGKINYQSSFSLLPNTIIDQYPSKGNKLHQGDSVDLFVTKSANSGN